MTNTAFPEHAEIALIANREVRVVAKGWRHPKRAGRYVALLPAEECPRTPEAQRAWAVEYGAPPRREAFMPDVEGLAPNETRIVAYETTTEGTPISPAFPNTTEGRLQLVRHCAEHATTWGRFTADAEAWAAILFGGDATVALDGTLVARGEGER